jgi:hypothetical protein
MIISSLISAHLIYHVCIPITGSLSKKKLIDSIFVKYQREKSLMTIKLEIHSSMHNERYDYVSYELKFA